MRRHFGLYGGDRENGADKAGSDTGSLKRSATCLHKSIALAC